MLDSDGFVRAGWVHELRLHRFSTMDCIKFAIRPDKLDLLFLISHFLDLGAGGRLLFITSLFKWP